MDKKHYQGKLLNSSRQACPETNINQNQSQALSGYYQQKPGQMLNIWNHLGQAQPSLPEHETFS